MCGIVGLIGFQPVGDRLLEAMKRLEYRGYDSAGIATVTNGALRVVRAAGKLQALRERLRNDPVAGPVGIGHIRWATHGPPTESNAHPHVSGTVAVVHNGIIENYGDLKSELVGSGVVFASDTDTEVVAHLLAGELQDGAAPLEALNSVLRRIRGSFALAIVFAEDDKAIYVARKGSPMVLGLGGSGTSVGSDAIALSGLAEQLCYLEDGDWGRISAANFRLFDHNNSPVERPFVPMTVESQDVSKGNWRTFMEKEIYEQPDALERTMAYYRREGSRMTDKLPSPDRLNGIVINACGSSFIAGLLGKYWLERLSRLRVSVEISSEFRYRKPVIDPSTLYLFISQSGETSDTLAALRHCLAEGVQTCAISNVESSSIAREADTFLPTFAGPEIGVASTKALMCQLGVLVELSLSVAACRGAPQETLTAAHEALSELPRRIGELTQLSSRLEQVALSLQFAETILFIGRGPNYALALEGALKLKELSYIHAEAYAAGELKHGAIALVERGTPVIVISPSGPHFDKTLSNAREVMARGGRIILITDEQGVHEAEDVATETIVLPTIESTVAPVAMLIPLQLLALHTARQLGRDIDQPRNLAKSVTVE